VEILTEMRSKIILITGASSGIGEASARLLAEQGHTVVLGARRVERIQSIAEEIRGQGGNALAQPLDVTDRKSFSDFAALALSRYGVIDVLVNNAGVMPISRLDELKVDDWDKMIDVNLRGVLNGIAAVLPTMLARNSGHLVNIGSVSAYSVGPTVAVYSATKYAVRALTEGFRSETKQLRATLISPGITRTELFDNITSQEPRDLLQGLAKDIAIPADSIANAISYAISQPPEVDVNELIVRPTALW
jgi:NADP-dependent 3-hydroxy acid dehydrogenase YdfG